MSLSLTVGLFIAAGGVHLHVCDNKEYIYIFVNARLEPDEKYQYLSCVCLQKTISCLLWQGYKFNFLEGKGGGGQLNMTLKKFPEVAAM